MYGDGKMLPPLFPKTRMTTNWHPGAVKSGILSVMAFRENAGPGQVDFDLSFLSFLNVKNVDQNDCGEY